MNRIACIDETDSPTETLARLSVFEQGGWMEFLAQTRVNEFFYFLRGELLTLPTEDDSLDSNNYICVYEILYPLIDEYLYIGA